jgi:hypothetical protein
MPLRRFGRAVRRQDWFTVVIELLVVVVGILLGLQVDESGLLRGARAPGGRSPSAV